jgi:hypothetical protein
MKNLRKLLALLLALCLLTGCAGGATGEETKEETTMASNHDGTLNLLMVGSSYCFYYVEELYDLLMENPPEGITQVNVYNLYYSGCRLTWHLNWWLKGEANYDFFKVDATGRQKMTQYEKWTLEQALDMEDWDFISLQGSPEGASFWRDDPREMSVNSAALAKPVLDHFHERFPNARLLWHNTWFKEVGRIDVSGHLYTAEEGPVYNAAMAEVCRYMCEDFANKQPYDLTMVPSGLAWSKARQMNETKDLLPYGGLCARLGYDKFGDGRPNSGDGSHDGDIGGGQFLNACVWYEVLTGKDCRQSSYIPTYTHQNITYKVDGELRTMLAEAAHQAVAETFANN